MRNETQFTLMTPAPGFTSRVLARIAEHERAQARRRAMIGSVLLVLAAIAILGLVAWWLVSIASVFVTAPTVLVAVLNVCASMAFWVAKFFESLWAVALIITQNVGAVEMLALAIGVITLTAIWVRVVAGPLQLSSRSILVGGSK
jgi:uncharacterized membrane protein